jgi:hypothetical protein
MRNRPLSLPAHGAIEFLAGIVMMLAPVALRFSAPALIVSAILGAVLTGSALGLSTQRPLSVASHTHFDSAFVIVTALAALGFALAGQVAAVVLLSAVVLLQAALSFGTRYAAA